MPLLKKLLHKHCQNFIEERIAAAKKAIENSQDASKNDTKSSAGDKYETGRAMAQQDIDRNQAQLSEALKQKQVLERINTDNTNYTVQLGSLIITDNGNFYMAISAGQINVDGQAYFAVSPASPIGLKLMGAKIGDEIEFNSKTYTLAMIC